MTYKGRNIIKCPHLDHGKYYIGAIEHGMRADCSRSTHYNSIKAAKDSITEEVIRERA